MATVVSTTATNKYRQQVRASAGGSHHQHLQHGQQRHPLVDAAASAWATPSRSFHSDNSTTWTDDRHHDHAGHDRHRPGGHRRDQPPAAGTLATARVQQRHHTTPRRRRRRPRPASPPPARTTRSTSPGTRAGATQLHVKRAGHQRHGPLPAWCQAGSTGHAVRQHRPRRTAPPTGSWSRPATRPAAAGRCRTGLGHADAAAPLGAHGRPGRRRHQRAESRGFVSCDLILPNVGGGVDAATLTAAHRVPDPRLGRRAGTGRPQHLGRRGRGGAAPTCTGSTRNTTYNFTITEGLQDATGAPFMPFSSSFTTGDRRPPPPTNVGLRPGCKLTTTDRSAWTSITIGPTSKVYAATITGEICRFDHQRRRHAGQPATLINTITQQQRWPTGRIIGLAFDPAATSSNLILWVTHGGAALKEAPDWSGQAEQADRRRAWAPTRTSSSTSPGPTRTT